MAWYADGGSLLACVRKQATRGRVLACNRWSVDVHMSSLAARNTWRGQAGDYAMVWIC